MIKKFRAKNYGCLKDVTIDLTPLHAFVGPNDSGKSTILRGIRTVMQFASGQFRTDQNGTMLPFNPLLDPRAAKTKLTAPLPEQFLACGDEYGWYGIKNDIGKGIVEAFGEPGIPIDAPATRTKSRNGWNTDSQLIKEIIETNRNLVAAFQGARLLRLDPDAMRLPTALALEPLDYFDDRGYGLPGIYQAILGRGDEASEEIRSAIRRLFPGIKRIGVKTQWTGPQTALSLEGELIDGSKFDAPAMSEGLLYFLAFSLIPYLSPVSVLLIEEPENGLHPARIQEVMRSLRTFVETTGTQVLMATHSPLVINELQPEEVSVVTKASVEEGTKVTRIQDTPNFKKRSSVYALGELWLAYADGKVEAPLFEGGAAP